MATAVWIWMFVVFVTETTADISRSNPSSGSCLCASGSGINVRSSACGSVIGQINSGQCFEGLGAKSPCSIRGVQYQFFKLQYGSRSGWVAGNYLVMGSASQCQQSSDISRTNPTSGSCLCASDSGVNVRSSACGRVIGQINSGECFEGLGAKSPCSIRGVQYQFFKLQYGSNSGWVAGNYLVMGSASQCQQSPHPSGGVCPRIVSRSAWGARPSRSTTSIRRPVPKVLIHHTESPSCHSQSDCSSRVRGFQNYHMDTHQWPDIGYNFLVGEDGNVYEGCGWDRVGIHARNWNPVSIGISVIGNFMNSPPNSAAQNAVRQLIACGVRMGKLSSAYTLHGHRDGVCTDCPGNSFYNLIKTWPRYGGRLPGGC